MIVAIWHMLNDDVDYQDLGADWFDRHRDPDGETRRLIHRLETLGHTVTLEPAA